MTAPRVVAVIPALDEEECIDGVVRGILPHVTAAVVVDNGSRDGTAAAARRAGATVVSEPRRGYGRACLAGIRAARDLDAAIVLFLDADGSDDPADAPALLGAVSRDEADLVLGVRVPALTEAGAMTRTQRFGNWLAPTLMRLTVGAEYRDMPPFKACSMAALEQLALVDTAHGFTIEMLVKAHRARLRVVQVDVRCRTRRGGASKVSGTLRGATRAATKIVFTIAKYALETRARR